jgi:ketosteroid isomerase-like protein
MKKKTNIMISIVGIFLFMLMVNSCINGPVDITDQIMESNKVFMSAFSSSDTNTLANQYTSDAKLFPANGNIVEGQYSIGEFWAATLKMGIKKVLFETGKAEKYGNIAIEEGKYTLFVEGDHIADQGKYIATWKKEDGKWKVFRDIWNVSTPAPQQRASFNDKVLVVLNHVKADKISQFENFNTNYLSPAGKEFAADVKKTVRMQKPGGQNKDGTYTYIYFMDPYVETYNYSILNILEAKYGEEKAQKYFNQYIDCLKDGNSQSFFAIETDW